MSESRSRDLFLKGVFVTGMLVTGTINTISKKAQNDSVAKGVNGYPAHSFDHPWFQTIVMFLGEFVCLWVFAIQTCVKTKEPQETINSGPLPPVKSNRLKDALIFIVPTFCDILGTSFGGIGLLWVSASVWQMMRGSIIIFSGILSVIFLKRKLLPYRWLGMLVVAGGLCVVGVSSFLGDSNSSKSDWKLLVLGIGLIIAGQFFSSVQMVLEEALLKNKNMQFQPLMIVGMEGMWGVILMSAIILPSMYFIHGSNQGSYENSWDAMLMIKNNMKLLIMILLYWISIAFYNFCGLSVTKKLTAVHRTLIDALRTICVWSIDIFIFYVISPEYGEAWTKYSYVQLIGFGLLLIGTMIYNAVIKIPRFTYEQPVAIKKEETVRLLDPSKEKTPDSIN